MIKPSAKVKVAMARMAGNPPQLSNETQLVSELIAPELVAKARKPRAALPMPAPREAKNPIGRSTHHENLSAESNKSACFTTVLLRATVLTMTHHDDRYQCEAKPASVILITRHDDRYHCERQIEI